MFEVEYYVTADGTVPFVEWLLGLLDSRAMGRIEARIERLVDGNFGDHKSVGEGLWELRLDTGPGYRVYYVLAGSRVVVIFCGGVKKSQRRDIKLALRYAADYGERTR